MVVARALVDPRAGPTNLFSATPFWASACWWQFWANPLLAQIRVAFEREENHDGGRRWLTTHGGDERANDAEYDRGSVQAVYTVCQCA